MIPHDDLARRLKAIAEAAPELRAAGVAALEIAETGAVKLTLAAPYGPPEPEPTVSTEPVLKPPPEPEVAPLDDPATFGTEGTPGYEIDPELELLLEQEPPA